MSQKKKPNLQPSLRMYVHNSHPLFTITQPTECHLPHVTHTRILTYARTHTHNTRSKPLERSPRFHYGQNQDFNLGQLGLSGGLRGGLGSQLGSPECPRTRNEQSNGSSVPRLWVHQIMKCLLELIASGFGARGRQKQLRVVATS